jgi:CHASE3 domain sensor protein
MARLKASMPFKIALLLFAGVVIIAFSGYLSYKSISSVVTLIYSNNTRDDGLSAIRDITTTIDRAENNVRLYGLTKARQLPEQVQRVDLRNRFRHRQPLQSVSRR